MRARAGKSPRVLQTATGWAVECTVTTPPHLEGQTVWIDLATEEGVGLAASILAEVLYEARQASR
jgi:hypothetical protein